MFNENLLEKILNKIEKGKENVGRESEKFKRNWTNEINCNEDIFSEKKLMANIKELPKILFKKFNPIKELKPGPYPIKDFYVDLC